MTPTPPNDLPKLREWESRMQRQIDADKAALEASTREQRGVLIRKIAREANDLSECKKAIGQLAL